MNSKLIGTKLKGFTLIELLIVIAIIAILSGSISMVVSGFQRDARIETNNNKAQMVYTGFQNAVIQAEIKQDDEVFNSARLNSAYDDTKKLKYVEIYFGMSKAKVDDIITVVSRVDGGTYIESVKRTDSDDAKKAYYALMEKTVLSYVDNTFEGTCAVYIDYENYIVDSVIYFEPNAFTADITNYSSGATSIGLFMSNYLNGSADPWKKTASGSYSFRMANDGNAQKTCVKYKGICFGAYPYATDFSTGGYAKA